MSKWEKVALKHIGEIVTGNTPSTKIDDYYNSNDIPFYKPNDISNTEVSKLNIATSYISETARSCARIIPCNSILVTCIGIIGKTAITTTECSCNQQINAIIPYKDLANSLYLAYAIMSKKTYMQDTANAPIVPIINKTKFASIEIPLPPLKEQHKIASILDTVSETLKLRKQQLNELDLLVKSKFIDMFGEDGKTVPLSKYVWFQEGPGVRSIDFTTTGTILLTGSNINNNKITFGHKSDRFISNELASSRYSHFICDKGDILVVSSAIDPVKFDKKVVIISDDKKYCLNTGIIRFKPDERYLSKTYFSEFLKTDYFKHQVINKMRGIAQMHFGPSHLKEMTILLPSSKKKQEQFNDFIKHIDELKSEVQKSIDQLQTLFDSLMQQYFE